jgi:hypothetical protein
MNISKVVFIAVIMMAFSGSVAANDDGYIGEVSIFAGNFSPRNHAFCNG